MCANLRLEGNFLEVVKDFFTSDINVSAKHPHEICKIFNGIVLTRVAFVLLIELISFSISAFVTSLKQNKF